MAKKVELKIEKYFDKKGKEYIIVKDKKDNTVRRFIYDERRTNIKNFHTEKRASEQSIRNYFALKHERETGEILEPTSKDYIKNKITTIVTEQKTNKKFTKNFMNENRLIFTGKKQVKNFDYVYINVKVRVFFDGHFSDAHGRSNYVYGKQIKDSQRQFFIHQAIIRAIAPYGSNVTYKPIQWSYVYHQQKYQHFDTL